MTTAFSRILTPYGYNSSIARDPAIWFSAQNALVQDQIADSIYSNFSYSYFDIEPVYSYLKESITLRSYVDKKLMICSNAAYLSYFSNNEASQTWFYNSESLAQAYTIDRICYDWNYWPTSLIRTYSILVTNSNRKLNQDVIARMDNCPPMYEYKVTIQAQYNLYVGLSIATAGLIAVFLIYVFFYYIPDKEEPLSMRAVMTPFNIALLAGLLSTIGYDISYALNLSQALADIYTKFTATSYLWYSLNIKRNILFTSSKIFRILWILSYLFFCWRRSHLQVQRIFPRFYKTIATLFFLSPILILSPIPFAIYQVVIPSAGAQSWSYWFEMTSILTLLLCDSLLLYCFLRFLSRTMTDKNAPIDPKFVIVSRMGILSVIPSIVMGGVDLLLAGTAESQDYAYMATWTTLSSFCIHAVMLAMVSMKIALYRRAIQDLYEFNTRGMSSEGGKKTANYTIFWSKQSGTINGSNTSRAKPSVVRPSTSNILVSENVADAQPIQVESTTVPLPEGRNILGRSKSNARDFITYYVDE